MNTGNYLSNKSYYGSEISKRSRATFQKVEGSIFHLESPDTESVSAMMEVFERFEKTSGLDPRKFSVFHYSRLEYFRLVIRKSIELFQSEFAGANRNSPLYKEEYFLFLDAVFQRYLRENTTAEQVKIDMGLAGYGAAPSGSTDLETECKVYSHDEMSCDSIESGTTGELFSEEEINYLLESSDSWMT